MSYELSILVPNGSVIAAHTTFLESAYVIADAMIAAGYQVGIVRHVTHLEHRRHSDALGLTVNPKRTPGRNLGFACPSISLKGVVIGPRRAAGTRWSNRPSDASARGAERAAERRSS